MEFSRLRSMPLHFLPVILVLSFALVSASARAQSYLYNLTDVAVGSGAAGIIFADFNHDGKSDLAVTNFYDNTVSIILAAKSGKFNSQVAYATGASPAALVAADFRGNGKVDLAVANENAGSVSVLLGNGDGTFQSHVDYTVGNNPVAAVAADLNSDGKIDLAVVNENDSTVSVLFGNGDGTFQAQTVVSVGSTPTAMSSGDFNGDGRVDLVTSCIGSGGVVSVLLSNGNGSFTRVDSSSGIQSPDLSEIAAGDFSGDGKVDVVVSSVTYSQIYLLIGKGNGSFGPRQALLKTSPGQPYTLVAADFNQDGKLDIGFGYGAPAGFAVVLGNGKGGFLSPVVSPIIALTGLAVSDINGDGRLDLAATTSGESTVGLYLGKGDGTFARPAAATLGDTVYGPNSSVSADFNGDGKLDIAAAEENFPNGQISVVLGNGNGTFGTPINSPILSQAINNQDLMLVGDFNGDGRPDLILMDDYSRGFQVLLGNGDGSFQPAVDTPISGSFNFTVGDLNGDGKTDVVVVGNVNFQTQVSIYLSNGDGTFHVGSQFTEIYGGGPFIADVNGDGKQDLVLISFGEPLLVLLGNGDGTFQNPISGTSALYSSPAVIKDFNGDGRTDIAVGTYNGLAYLQGNGDGTFQDPLYSNPATSFCCQMVSGDVNGDGKLDLVTNLIGTVAVMVGNGDGTFQAPLNYSSNGQLYSGNITVGDFNSDRVSDLGFTIQNLYPISATIVSMYLSSPTVSLFPTSVNFGSVQVGKTSPAAKIQVNNLGNAPLVISSITVSSDFIEQNNCGKGLAIGKSCTIQVSFKPTTTGVRTGAITVKDNALVNSQQISLKGIGQ